MRIFTGEKPNTTRRSLAVIALVLASLGCSDSDRSNVVGACENDGVEQLVTDPNVEGYDSRMQPDNLPEFIQEHDINFAIGSDWRGTLNYADQPRELFCTKDSKIWLTKAGVMVRSALHEYDEQIAKREECLALAESNSTVGFDC